MSLAPIWVFLDIPTGCMCVYDLTELCVWFYIRAATVASFEGFEQSFTANPTTTVLNTAFYHNDCYRSEVEYGKHVTLSRE